MNEAKLTLSDKQIEFLKDEFDLPPDKLKNISKEEWHNVRLKCFDIELEETTDDDCSERGELAADIVSVKYGMLFE